jgi:hypothetical protein
VRRAAFALILLAGGCQHRPRAIEIPVAIPCIRAGEVPPPVPPAGPLPADSGQAADRLAAIILRLRANERILRALIAPCTGAELVHEGGGDPSEPGTGRSGQASPPPLDRAEFSRSPSG